MERFRIGQKYQIPNSFIMREVIAIKVGYVTCKWTSFKSGKTATIVYYYSSNPLKEDFLLPESNPIS